MKKNYSIPPELEAKIVTALSELKVDLADSKKIAEAVLRMSDFYIKNPQAKTPWQENWCKIAQIAYYLPLNYLRNQAVFTNAEEVGFKIHSKHLVDFGAGLGAGSSVWSHRAHIIYCESSGSAKEFLEAHFNPTSSRCEFRSENELEALNSFSSLFSYSLTEQTALPKWALNSENLIIVEPSTQEDGRKLLKLRALLQSQGYFIWAPCTHQKPCPLLTHSKTDWCHDRIFFKMPGWFHEIEKRLPIKNSTLTFSYLLASRKPAPESKKWRITGDRLEEKGKTRQLVCRGEEREFLAWMHKHGDFESFQRGELIAPFENISKISNELRITNNS